MRNNEGQKERISGLLDNTINDLNVVINLAKDQRMTTSDAVSRLTKILEFVKECEERIQLID